MKSREPLTPAVLRKRAGLTQRQVAAYFNVRVQTVSDWERHRTYPDLSFTRVLEFTTLYHCTVQELAIAFDRLHPDE